VRAAHRRTIRRLSFGVIATGLALWPLAVPAGAGTPPSDLLGDPPAEFTPDTTGVFTDAELEQIISGMSLLQVQAAMTGDRFPDQDGDGIPDVPEGEPGDLDIRPGDQSLADFISVLDGQVVGAATEALAERAAASVPAGQPVPTYADTRSLINDNSKLQGHCAGVAISYDADGNAIDAAVGVGSTGNGLLVDTYGDGAGERAFTSANRFEVRADGKVVYFGYMPFGGTLGASGQDGPRDHVWEIRTSGVSLDKGGDDNPQGNNANAGVVDMGDNIPGPLRFTGNADVSGELFALGNGLWCVAEGQVHFGGPFPPVAGGIATVLAAGGFLGLLFNSRPALTFKA
jgi:hypothetical protein